MSGNAVELLLEKLQVCPDDVHTRLNLHQRLRNETHKDSPFQEPCKTRDIKEAGGTAATLTTPGRQGDGEGLLTKLSRTYSSSPVINVWVAVCARNSTSLEPSSSPQDTALPSTSSKSRAWAGAIAALGDK